MLPPRAAEEAGYTNIAAKTGKQRRGLPTHALTGRAYHLFLEMGIGCQVMVLGSMHCLHHGCTKTEYLQYLSLQTLTHHTSCATQHLTFPHEEDRL